MSNLKPIFFLAIIGLVLSCNSAVDTATPKPTPSSDLTEQDTITYSEYQVSWSEIQSLPKSDFDFMVPYGADDLQFGELRTPTTQDTFPVVVFLHGGCWESEFDLSYLAAAAGDLVKAGYAVWTPEYRRIGNEGGGYPGTFQDAQTSVDYLRTLAAIYPLDTNKVVLMGHSAGGHLALWLAVQENLPKNTRLYNPNPLAFQGVISLAGITDLETYDALGNNCSSSVKRLMGGSFVDKKDRYYKGSPSRLLPSQIPLRLVHGEFDKIVPRSQAAGFVQKAEAQGSDATLIEVAGAGHFDMVSPYSKAWEVIKSELDNLIKTN
ncbi:MAG: alpha/beta hydrolase [Bacteroidota bacterium]